MLYYSNKMIIKDNNKIYNFNNERSVETAMMMGKSTDVDHDCRNGSIANSMNYSKYNNLYLCIVTEK